MVDVFIVWHIAHADVGPGETVRHRDATGELALDEQAGDDVKLLGVYSTEAAADARVELARTSPGFALEPDCFMVVPYRLDEDHWSEGFVRLRD